ncbi:uncharacterized protein LOC123219589 [Mangifera indica]|uniref:uncharacterized protein LOC123219589 n=1 Tax=Mangifera indica TaxID=29780 RepID=UPI001CFABCE4|nr:uncharacterized protein LOC123219589 [Mangifera indica]
MKNMTTSMMSTLLAFVLIFLAISAQARTLSDWQNKISMITDNGRLSPPLPPPSPNPSPSPGHLTTGHQRTLPSPSSLRFQPSSPYTGAPCVAGSPCNGVIITMVTDWKEADTKILPTLKPSPSEHQANVKQLLHKTSSQNYRADSLTEKFSI